MGFSHIHSLSQKSLVQVETIGESASRIRHGYDAGFFGPAIPAVICGNELRRLFESAPDGDVCGIYFDRLNDTPAFLLFVYGLCDCRFQYTERAAKIIPRADFRFDSVLNIGSCFNASGQ